MKKHLLILTLFSCLFINATEIIGQQHTIKGYITTSESGEALLSANVFDENSLNGTVTNDYGFYSLTLDEGPVKIVYSYIGYNNIIAEFDLTSDTTISIELSSSVDLEEVVVKADKTIARARETQMSTISLGAKEIKAIPALLGEVDVLKSLQLLPGVQSGGEGQSGLFVRGGSPDQNLLLLDGVPVYNASHLFGFFSVFNADAINDVKLIKGGFPARYGGRLSSVIEVNMKEGNKKKISGAGSIGLISSKLTIEGPIGDKTSFMVSGRRTYIDLLARPIIKSALSQEEGIDGVLGYYFYDLNAKINHTFNDKDRLYLSFYSGRDAFYADIKEKTEFDESSLGTNLGWGNYTSVLRWNHLFTDNLFSNLSASYSRYRINTSISNKFKDLDNNVDEIAAFEYDSGIEDIALNYNFDYLPNPDHYIKFGMNSIYHTFNPGQFDLFGSSDGTAFIDTLLGQDKVKALEYALYIEDDYKINEKWKVNGGLHFSGFGLKNANYLSLQPRLSARYLINDELSLKGSFTTMRQYIQLLAFEGLGLPTDLWVPSTKRVKPQDAWQATIGAAKDIGLDYEFSAEVYYKDMRNLVAYKDGAGVFQLDDWEDRVVQGDGRSFGFEFFAKKKTGRWTGWLGYTWSKTDRQFDDINFGEWFPFKFDRRHDISLVFQYDINEKWDFSTSWVYGTGNAATISYEQVPFTLSETLILDRADIFNTTFASYPIVDQRNNYRLRDFHRWDVGFVRKLTGSSYNTKIAFGAYNAYNRKNPFFVDYDTATDQNGNQRTVLREYSLFPIIPYVNINFDF